MQILEPCSLLAWQVHPRLSHTFSRTRRRHRYYSRKMNLQKGNKQVVTPRNRSRRKYNAECTMSFLREQVTRRGRVSYGRPSVRYVKSNKIKWMKLRDQSFEKFNYILVYLDNKGHSQVSTRSSQMERCAKLGSAQRMLLFHNLKLSA